MKHSLLPMVLGLFSAATSSVMRNRLLLLLPLLATTTLAAQPAPATLPADPMAESRRIDAEIRKLWQAIPKSGEMDELDNKYSQLSKQLEDEGRKLSIRFQEFEDSDAYRQYASKSRELEMQRQDKWVIERKAIAAVARQLYAARHAELRKIAPAAIPQGQALGLDVLTFPRIDGSTSTHPLNVILASRLLGIPYEWLYPEPSGSPWTEHAMIPRSLFLGGGGGMRSDREEVEFTIAASRVVAQPPAATKPGQQRVAVMINSLLAANTTTHDAYVNLIEGKCDLNLNARPPSASELKFAQQKGVKIALKPIAKDAMVFMVHRENPVQSLTSRQLRDIYEEKFKQWKDVAADPQLIEQWRGGRGDGPKGIVPLRREPDSGSRELFDALVMQGKQLPESKSKWLRLLYTGSMAGPYNRITQEPNALGYSVYYYEHFMALSPYTRNLAIDGVEPTAESIASGKYPLIAPVYAAYRETDPPDSPVMKLLNWLLSPEGQAVIRESGYVPAQ